MSHSQFMIKLFSVLFMVLGVKSVVFAQGLDKICPVILRQSTFESDASFILTATDYDFFLKQPDKFYNNIQIIDANQPWPPRWFSAMPQDTSLGLPYSALIPLNASYQNNKLSYFSIIKSKGKGGKELYEHGYILCDSNLNVTDTFVQAGHDLDHHDFQLGAHGEKLFFSLYDSTIDLSSIHHRAKDTALNLFYEKIEIADSTGHIVFSWSPLKNLGADAPYSKYWNVKGFWNKPDIFDWSHGNSICFDYDGDILYSYKFIGIGKISRKDGHIIWKVDRKQIQANSFSDSLPLFLQHDFKGASDSAGNHFYTFISNGDNQNRRCAVCQFTVKDTLNGQKVFKIKSLFEPVDGMPNTGGGGNYDVETNGNYLINYGHFKSDTSKTRALFEYRNSKGHLLASYSINPFILSYRIHKLNNLRPARPYIEQTNGVFTVSSSEATWYELNNKTYTATVAGTGKTFKPSKPGLYCAAVKYGIGYSVSVPVLYKK